MWVDNRQWISEWEGRVVLPALLSTAIQHFTVQFANRIKRVQRNFMAARYLSGLCLSSKCESYMNGVFGPWMSRERTHRAEHLFRACSVHTEQNIEQSLRSCSCSEVEPFAKLLNTLRESETWSLNKKGGVAYFLPFFSFGQKPKNAIFGCWNFRASLINSYPLLSHRTIIK